MQKVNKKIKNATENTYKGLKFRSKLESDVAKLLDYLHIPYKYESVKFELVPSFKYEGTTIRAITYTPDFIIGNYIIECKGFPSDSWKIKRKLFMKYLVDIKSDYIYKEIFSVSDMLNMLDMDDRFRTYNILVKDLKGNIIGEYNSLSEALDTLNLKSKSIGNINSCLLGKRNKAYGYIWERVERTFSPIEGEDWRPIPGFEGLYMVSSLGRVASVQFHGKNNFKLMSLTDIDGYKFVKLRNWKKSIEGSYSVHRLVASTFLENPEGKEEVDHLDTNPSNNKVSNLKWTTHLENQRNPITNNRLKSNMIEMNKIGIGPKVSAMLKRRPVKFVDSENQIHFYNSLQEASDTTGKSISSIHRWCNRGIKGWSYDSTLEN